MVIPQLRHAAAAGRSPGARAALAEKRMSRPRGIAVIGCGRWAHAAHHRLAPGCGDDILQGTGAAGRSAARHGGWTPDSRICLAGPAGPQFGEVWEKMPARPGRPMRLSRPAWRTRPLQRPLYPVDHSFAEIARDRDAQHHGLRPATWTDRPISRPAANPSRRGPRFSEVCTPLGNPAIDIRAYAHMCLPIFAPWAAGSRCANSTRRAKSQCREGCIKCTGSGPGAMKDESIVAVRAISLADSPARSEYACLS